MSAPNAGSGSDDDALDVRRIAIVAVVLVTVVVACGLAAFGIERLFDRIRGRNALQPHAPAMTSSSAPALQAFPGADLESYRTAKQSALHSYGWVDREAGVAHIPIEDAMRMLAANASRSAADQTGNASVPQKSAQPKGEGER